MNLYHIEFKDIKLGDWVFIYRIRGFNLRNLVLQITRMVDENYIVGDVAFEQGSNVFSPVRDGYSFGMKYRKVFRLSEDEVINHIVLEHI
jgi:hypothetical protein